MDKTTDTINANTKSNSTETELSDTSQYCLPSSLKPQLDTISKTQPAHVSTYGTYGACACCKPGDFFSFLEKKRFVGPDTETNSFQGNRYMQGEPVRSRQIQSFALGNSGAPASSKPNGISEE